jgi:hypothetical protein
MAVKKIAGKGLKREKRTADAMDVKEKVVDEKTIRRVWGEWKWHNTCCTPK